MSWLDRAERVIPGGVNSPVRAFRGVGGVPVVIKSAAGTYLTTSTGGRLLDYIGSYGPMILGHADAEVTEAIRSAATGGTSFGAPTLGEIDLAELIVEAFPAMDMVRLVNSGTEATMSALRVARAATQRDGLLKFAGCYHGHADPFLISAGSGAATIGTPSSPGVPASIGANTHVAPFNDIPAVEAIFSEHPNEIAAIFVEPVVGNMGLVPPTAGFLEKLREVCDREGALLVFDEVMTGFRVAWGGCQTLFGIEPDLTTLGKIIGGGLPIGAYGGRADLMKSVAPSGPVYQAGTLSGNPLAVAAGLTTLRKLSRSRDTIYLQLEQVSGELESRLSRIGRQHSIPLTVQRQGSMFSIFFSAEPVHNIVEVDNTNLERFSRVFHRLLEGGVHIPPSPYETWFVSARHGQEEIELTATAFDRALALENSHE